MVPYIWTFDSIPHICICLMNGYLYAFDGGGKPYHWAFDKLFSQIAILASLVPGSRYWSITVICTCIKQMSIFKRTKYRTCVPQIRLFMRLRKLCDFVVLTKIFTKYRMCSTSIKGNVARYIKRTKYRTHSMSIREYRMHSMSCNWKHKFTSCTPAQTLTKLALDGEPVGLDLSNSKNSHFM